MSGIEYIGYLEQIFLRFRQNQSFVFPRYTYGQTGTANMPTHTAGLTATWNGRVLSVTKSMRRKSDAKKEAARAICEMIADHHLDISQPDVVQPSLQPTNRASTYQGSNDRAKNELQEIVQKQPGHTLPKYDCISISGQQHQPTFCVKVTVVWNGEELEEMGEGSSIKGAGKCAAEQMLQRLNGRGPSRAPASSSGPSASRRRPSSIPTISGDMALDRAKNRLQEVLQKRGCRLPSYSTQKDGPAHNPTFTTTVTINRAGRTIYTAQASASQKRRAEKLCAQKAFPAVLNLLDNMTDDDLELPSSPSTPSEHLDEHPDIDEEQLSRLRRHTRHMPHVICEKESSNTTVCLISVQLQNDNYILAQGTGTTSLASVHCAMKNLLRDLETQ